MAVTVTVENGSGIPGANSYSIVAAFKAYAEQQGWSLTGISDDQIGSALIRGTSGLDGLYGAKFPGVRTNPLQGLQWPRKAGSYVNGTFVEGYPVSVSDSEGVLILSNVVPARVVAATHQLAWRELQKPGSTTPDVAAGGGFQRIKAGSVEVSRFSPGSYSSRASFAVVDGILAGLLGQASLNGAAEVDLLRV